MKGHIIKLLHHVFGYERYLRIFSILKIKTLSFDRRKSDFLFFEQLIDQSATVVVIGACTGITTIPFAKNKPQRNIVAYEPLASNFTVLNQVVHYFQTKNIITYQVGLGNKTEKREMILPVLKGVKKQGMAHIKDETILEYNDGETIWVDLDTLDHRKELKGLKINAIKLVAENFEYPILVGAKETIEAHQPLIYCELWNNEKRHAVLNLIQEYGYEIYFREGSLLVPFLDNYSGKNFIFKPSNA